MEVVAFVAVFALIIVVRVWLHFLDVARIKDAARRKGWGDVDVSWAPFAPGFLFEKGERHYLVAYFGEGSNIRRHRYCKTSMLTGVYWREGL